MVMSLIAIAIVGLIAFLGMNRGFFSSSLNMVCVLVAGAIAFAFWEPLAYLILDKVAGNKGFFSFLPGMAWGVALVVPFSISLALLRVVTDKLVIANVTVSKLTDYIGGALCGAVSGVVTAGILMMAFGLLWAKTDGKMAFQRLDWDANGRLESKFSLWLPVDEYVATAYGMMSKTTLSSEYSLARMYPNLADVPSSMRQSLFGGKGRPTMAPKEFKVLGGYTVGADEDFNSGLDSTGSVLAALGSDDNFKPVTDRFGVRLDVPGNYIAGYSMSFESTARERGSSQVVFGPGQLRLVCENGQGDSVEMFPFAFITRAEQADVKYLRYDFIQGVFPATFQESQPKMGFEFFVPGGYKPAWLYAKNTRVDVREVKYDLLTPAQRATRLDDKSLIELTKREFDVSQAITFSASGNLRGSGINVKNFLPLGMIIQDGSQGSMQIDDSNKIIRGTEVWLPEALDKRGIDKALQIKEFDVPRISTLVQIQVTATSRVASPAINLTEPPMSSARPDEPIFLVDDAGYAYSCIGYAYKDRQQVKLRYTRSDVLNGLKDLPSVPSRSRRDQEIVLIFEVQDGKRISGFAVGNTMFVKFDPPIEVKRRN